jgi:4-diphosphocytidyl-2-C-methyl-D-erythritol kinase
MIRLRANAKLTWYLEVTGRRDNGYHELRSEMTTLDFGDVIVVDETGDYLRVIGSFEESVPTDSTNIVARALALVGRRAGVVIDKSIPVGGGLGGGSADAAAILRWAGGVDAQRAIRLGGDVPFCQAGGRALVEGVGERVTPLAFEARDVTLIMARGLSVNTQDCYRAYDELRASGWTPTGRNHLETPAGLVEPRLATTLEWLRAEIDPQVHLAGSGSTMFVEGHLRSDVGQWDVKGPDVSLAFHQTTTTPA